MGKDGDMFGINVGISISHKNINDYNEFAKSLFFGNKQDTLKEIGEVLVTVKHNNISIPVYVHGGNSYNEMFGGTSCLFGYIKPNIIAPDEWPTMVKTKCERGK